MTENVHDDAGRMYMTAAEAAAALGVSRATLYAYVSRRGIRSETVAGSRERLYWRPDVLGARRAKGRPATKVETRPLPETAISLISADRLYYRGLDAVELAESATFEEATALLWNEPPEPLFTDRLPAFPAIAGEIGALLASKGGIERGLAMLPLIEAANPRSYDFSPAGLVATGADVVRTMAAILLKRERPSAEPVHEQVGRLKGLAPEWRDLARRMLVLSADHGFEPSTYAVRSVASIGVSPYRSVAAGLLLLSGRRTLLGRVEGLSRLLDEVIDGDPEAAVIRRLKEGDQLPGFGFRTYEQGDPRTAALLSRLDEIASGDVQLRRLKHAISIVHDALGLRPDYALVANFVSRRLMGDERDSLFVLGRCAGWIAHAIEQYRAGETVRSPSIYTGPLPRRA